MCESCLVMGDERFVFEVVAMDMSRGRESMKGGGVLFFHNFHCCFLWRKNRVRGERERGTTGLFFATC